MMRFLLEREESSYISGEYTHLRVHGIYKPRQYCHAPPVDRKTLLNDSFQFITECNQHVHVGQQVWSLTNCFCIPGQFNFVCTASVMKQSECLLTVKGQFACNNL